VPTISVVIPVYRARHLRVALESVRAQTFHDYEIVVVDDGSPDRTELEAALGTDRDHLRLLKQENRGPSAARNAGVQAARGAFVAFLDADDTWEPTYLEEQIAALTGPPGAADMSYCNWMTMGITATRAYGPITCVSLLRDECQIILSGVVVRRDAILTAGLFDERFRHAEDFDLWLRMLKTGARLEFHRRPLLNRRVHDGSLSYDTVNHGEKALLVLEKFRNRPDLTGDERAAVEWRLRSIAAEVAIERAKRAVAEGDFAAATRAIADANEFYRSWKLRLVTLLLRLWPGLVARVHDARQRRQTASQATADRP
jgi:glycosyltransferase involved in cell wall biosynthesis